MKEPQGFIALMSVLVISAVLMLIATGGSFSGFYGRVNALGFENKERTYALAYACVNQTLLELAHDSTYSGQATTTVSGSNVCYTGIIINSGTTYSFRTRAQVNGSYTALAVSAKVVDVGVQSVTEISTF